jgi:hypothetical protein
MQSVSAIRARIRKYPTLGEADYAEATAPWRLGVLLKRAKRLRPLSDRPDLKPRKQN